MEECRERLEEALGAFNDSMTGQYYAELIRLSRGEAEIALYEEGCPSCSLDEAIVALIREMEAAGLDAEIEGETQVLSGERLLRIRLACRE